jgi:long-chain acyl-CoA synthetase
MEWAIKMKREALDTGSDHSLFLDWLLFSQFRGILGGRIRLIVSGGAPLLPDVHGYLRAVTTPNIIQGYGATEVAAAGCVQEVGDRNPLTVGPVCISADLKFRRVPGMHYDPNGSPPSGELLFRGPSVFRGYLKDDASTRDVFADGWFASGDVGCLTSDGQIEIIDRVKQCLKLSQGEYIAPETLAMWYSQTRCVRHIYVFADSHHSQPVAVVVPSQAAVMDWAARKISDIANSETVKQEILRALAEKAEQLGLRQFEKILDIIVETVTFTLENGMLRDSLEPHFSALRSKYEARLLELYDRHK